MAFGAAVSLLPQPSFAQSANQDSSCVTIAYGDTTGDNTVDVDDLLCVLRAFAGNFTSCPLAYADLAPCEGNGIIDVGDITAVLSAFSEQPQCAPRCDPCLTNNSPQAAGGADLEVEAGALVTFDGSSSFDQGGRIAAYQWEFGDGGTGTGASATHTYISEGTYTVTLTVVDSCGATDTDQLSVTVSNNTCSAGNELPRAAAGGNREALAGDAVMFDGSASSDSDGFVLDYWWNFGDGYSTGWQQEKKLTHTYAEAGTYLAQLWVRDNCGAISLPSAITVTVESESCNSNQLPAANAGGNRSAEVGQTLVFDGSASSDPDGFIQTYRWDFDDGTSAQGRTVSHAYAQGGTYRVALTVTDNCGAARVAFATVTVSEPGGAALSPELLGFVQGGVGTAQGVAVGPDGQHLYVASMEFGVVEFDITDPTNPVFARNASDFFNAQRVTITPSWLVTGGSTTGARALGLDAFATPGEQWSEIKSVAQDTKVRGNLAFVAAGSSGLKIVDLSSADPSNPLDSVQLFARGVAVSPDGRWAYVAGGSENGFGSFSVLNVQTPSAISEVARISTASGGNASSVVVSSDGRRVYVADYGGGLTVVDVANPNAPRVLSSTGKIGAGVATRVALMSNIVVVLTYFGSSGVRFFDVTNGSNPVELGLSSGGFLDIAVSGNYVFAANGSAGVTVIDAGNPSNPVVVATNRSSQLAHYTTLATDGQIAIVGGTQALVSVVDVSQPQAPQFLSRVSTAAQGVAMKGNYGYVASGASGLHVLNVSNPSAPAIIHTVSTFARGVALSDDGQFAYVAAGTAGGVQVYDVHPPHLAPVLLGQVVTPGNAGAIVLDASGRYAFVADFGSGLTVVDVSVPANPRVVGQSLAFQGPANSITRMGSYVVLATSGKYPEAVVVDVSDPAAPQEVASIPGQFGSMAFYDSYLMLPTGLAGLLIYDLANPADPELAFTVSTPGSISSAFVHGDMVYVGDWAALVDTIRLVAP